MANTPKTLFRGTTNAPGGAWTARNAMPSAQNWSGIAYGNGIFLAVAATGNTVGATSPDGVTWTARTLPSSAGSWSAVTFGNGQFVAVPTGSNVVAVSSDGINWSTGTLPSSQTWSAVAYGNGYYVTVASDTNIAASSTDGITWTQRTLPNTYTWSSIAFGNGIFVAVAATGGSNAASSINGTSWTARTMPGSSGEWKSVAFGNGTFVAAAANLFSTVNSSTDGITWTARGVGQTKIWAPVVYANSTFMLLGQSNVMATSAEGASYTLRSNQPNVNTWSAIASGNATVVALASPSTSAVLTGTPVAGYRVPAATTTVLTDLHLNNPNSSTATVSVYVDGVELVSNVFIQNYTHLVYTPRQVLTTGKTITATSSLPVTVHACGVELT